MVNAYMNIVHFVLKIFPHYKVGEFLYNNDMSVKRSFATHLTLVSYNVLLISINTAVGS